MKEPSGGSAGKPQGGKKGKGKGGKGKGGKGKGKGKGKDNFTPPLPAGMQQSTYFLFKRFTKFKLDEYKI